MFRSRRWTLLPLLTIIAGFLGPITVLDSTEELKRLYEKKETFIEKGGGISLLIELVDENKYWSLGVGWAKRVATHPCSTGYLCTGTWREGGDNEKSAGHYSEDFTSYFCDEVVKKVFEKAIEAKVPDLRPYVESRGRKHPLAAKHNIKWDWNIEIQAIHVRERDSRRYRTNIGTNLKDLSLEQNKKFFDFARKTIWDFVQGKWDQKSIVDCRGKWQIKEEWKNKGAQHIRRGPGEPYPHDKYISCLRPGQIIDPKTFPGHKGK
jgi:hypothetical protein